MASTGGSPHTRVKEIFINNLLIQHYRSAHSPAQNRNSNQSQNASGVVRWRETHPLHWTCFMQLKTHCLTKYKFCFS